MRRNKSKILAFSAKLGEKTQIFSKKIQAVSFNNVDKICIYANNGGVGDILMLTPSLKSLRDKYPNSYIELAIHSNGANDNIYNFISELKLVDKISDFRKVNKNRYGTVIDVSEVADPAWEMNKINLRSRIKYYSELCRVTLDKEIPYIPVPSQYTEEAKKFLKNYSKVFFIDTSSVDDRRCISPEVVKKLIDLINKNNSNHCILVSDWRRKSNLTFLKNTVDVTSKSLIELSALIKESDYFFGPDSALMHIAGAFEIKSLVAFGMIPPEYRIKEYKNHKAVRVEKLSCLECWYKPCTNNLKCMKDLDSNKIYEMMERM